VGNATEYPKPFTVGPGDNGRQWIQKGLKVGDVMIVTFAAKPPYKLVSAYVTSSSGAAWTQTGFTFKLIITKDIDTRSTLEAHWNGELSLDGPGGVGQVKVKPKPITWDLTGLYTVLGDHEGAGDDLGRDPIGSLKSDKPNAGKPPVEAGKATYDEATKSWVGTFTEPDAPKQTFTGQYESGTAKVDPKTATPFALGTETKDCPDCGKVKVIFCYYGCTASGGFGGRAIPDIITINTYSSEPELTNQKVLLEKRKMEREAAAAKVKEIEAQIKKLTDELAKAQADLNNAIDAFVKNAAAVKAAQAAVDKANAEVAGRQTAVQNAKVRLDKALAKGNQTIIGQAQKVYNHALSALTISQNHLADAEKKLAAAQNKAREAANKDPNIIKLQKIIVAKTAERQKLDDVLSKAQTALNAAIAAEAKVVDHITFLEDLETQWKNGTKGLIAHEEEHRAICYFYADKLTTMLNALRAWGYAQKLGRAQTIGRKRFAFVWKEKARAIQDENDAKQTLFDTLTNHGEHPEDWNRAKELQ